ncbi:MAG: hypothetical protein U0802_21840 [Candidatus Binatia bacterium]
MTTKWIRSGLLMAAFGAAVVAAPARGADQISPAAQKEADDILKNRCQMCHGASGKGDGPAGAALNPKPRNWTDPAWQKSVTDETLQKAILGGGQSVGLSPLMPANPDLASKPEVVKALVAIVRSYSGK